MEIQRPYCVAMVLCDAVHRDNSSGKFTLLGTFSRILANEFPTQTQFAVFFCVTDAIGEGPIGLRIVDSAALLSDDTIEPIAEINGTLQSQSPLVVVEGVLGMAITFPKAGVYHCELFCGDELLMSRRLIVDGPPEEKED